MLIISTKILKWRRRRDSNSRAGSPTYTLSRGASSANLSTSPNSFTIYNYGRGGGIRTHVGLHPNGFQDRPVMTASVPLVTSVKIITTFFCCVNYIFMTILTAFRQLLLASLYTFVASLFLQAQQIQALLP